MMRSQSSSRQSNQIDQSRRNLLHLRNVPELVEIPCASTCVPEGSESVPVSESAYELSRVIVMVAPYRAQFPGSELEDQRRSGA